MITLDEDNKKAKKIDPIKDELKAFESSTNIFVMSPSRRIRSRHDQFEGQNFMVGPLLERHVKKLMEENRKNDN